MPLGIGHLSAGLSCNIFVTFTPTASGIRTGKVTINDNAADTPQSVSLTGTGTTSPPPAPGNLTATVTPGNVAVLDTLDWFTLDADLAANNFMAGTSTPTYTVVEFGAKRFWRVKNASGFPWDVDNFDDTFIYDKYTEQIFTDPTTWKDHLPGFLGYPWAHRKIMYDPTQAGALIDVIDSFPANFDIHNTPGNCNGTFTSSNLGHVKTEMWGPFTETFGGTLPANLTTFHLQWMWNCDSSFNNCGTKEINTISKRYGRIRWQTFDLVNGVYQQKNEALTNTLTSGTTTPVHPCFP
jgi:hypothetical protein